MTNFQLFIILVSLVAVVTFIVLNYFLRRDKKQLALYNQELKDKIKRLKNLLHENDESGKSLLDLLSELNDYVKTLYDNEFRRNNKAEKSQKLETFNSKKEQKKFLFLISYQMFKIERTAFDNLISVEDTWNKIESQLSKIIAQWIVVQEREFEQIVINKSKELNEAKKDNHVKRDKEEKKELQNEVKEMSSHSDDILLQERKNEIERLRSQLTSQQDKFSHLQEMFQRSGESSDDELQKQLEIVQQQLKDYEHCVSLMDADIASQHEEIITLKEKLENNTNQDDSVVQILSNDQSSTEGKMADIERDKMEQAISDLNLTRDTLIQRFAQESKDMIMIIDQKEQTEEELKQRIEELEQQLKVQ